MCVCAVDTAVCIGMLHQFVGCQSPPGALRVLCGGGCTRKTRKAFVRIEGYSTWSM